MKVYCAGPIRGDCSYAEQFREMVRSVRRLGHIPLTELASQLNEEPSQNDEMIFRRDMSWLDQARALVAEVSAPSLGVGYEIAYALHVRKIPVLCLYHRGSRSLSAMLSGNFSRLLNLELYETKEELEEKLRAFLEKCP